MLDDKEIILKIKEGEDKAFYDLYNKYAEYALRTAAVVTKNKSSAADAVQEAFIRVYKNLGSFDTNQPFKPWFYRILINECNRLMKNIFGIVYISDYLENTPDDIHHDDYQFEEYEELYSAIGRLKATHRIPIVLKYLNGLTENEIADILGLNINTVKSRLLKGRKKLKEVLESFNGRRIVDVRQGNGQEN